MSERDPSLNPNLYSGVPASLTELGNAPTSDVLIQQNRQIDTDVKSALAQKIETIGGLELPESRVYFSNQLSADISGLIESQGYESRMAPVEPPKRKNEVTKDIDLAFNMKGPARKKGESEDEVASSLAAKVVENDYIARATTIGSYVNLELDYELVAPRVISEVLEQKDKFGHFRDGDPQLVIVDYSSPNVAKDMTAAHLRSTAIGHSIVKLQEASGNIPFGINHIGDWGAQFGGIIYEYKRELSERGEEFQQELNADPTKTLMTLYREFKTKEGNKDTEAISSAQRILERLEGKDPELMELWHQFREWTLPAFLPVYEQLGVSFDAIQGESFYDDRMAGVIEEAFRGGILKVNDEGSMVLPFQPLTDPTTGKTNDKDMLNNAGKPRDEVLLKPNGGTVYLTRDLSAISYRAQELQADKILYVIGKEQRLHCLMLFAMADQLGYMPTGTAEHVSFGHLNGDDGRKQSTRDTKQPPPLLKEVLAGSIEAASKELEHRKLQTGDNSELTPPEHKIAEQIGVSAVIFNDLKHGREKDIRFNAEEANIKEAGNSVYIQYTHARLNSVLEKVGEPESLTEIPTNLSGVEKAVLLQTAMFPGVVKEAAEENAPHKIANYLTSYCQEISTFYADHPIGTANTAAERNFRLNLTKAAKQVISNAADLINITLPDRM